MSKHINVDSRKLITNLLFRKWTFPIIQALGTDTKRYSTLSRLLPEVAQKVLTEHLRQLERAGIVRRFFLSHDSTARRI